MTADPLLRAEAEVARIIRACLEPRYAPLRPAMMSALRPQDGDYRHVFAEGAAHVARRGYAVFWNNQPSIPTVDAPLERIEIQTVASWSQDLHLGGPRATAFPRGYLDVARFLASGIIWVVADLVVPGRTRKTRVDGFVPVAGRWRWFPRPYRVLPAKSGSSGFWTE